jgi:hypothetical protein
MILPDARSLPHGLAQLPGKLGRTARGKGLDHYAPTSARHRVDHGTICGRSCANSGHYKPLCACVDRTKFVAPASVAGLEFFSGQQGHSGLSACPENIQELIDDRRIDEIIARRNAHQEDYLREGV